MGRASDPRHRIHNANKTRGECWENISTPQADPFEASSRQLTSRLTHPQVLGPVPPEPRSLVWSDVFYRQDTPLHLSNGSVAGPQARDTHWQPRSSGPRRRIIFHSFIHTKVYSPFCTVLIQSLKHRAGFKEGQGESSRIPSPRPGKLAKILLSRALRHFTSAIADKQLLPRVMNCHPEREWLRELRQPAHSGCPFW